MESFMFAPSEVADIASDLEKFREQWLEELKQPASLFSPPSPHFLSPTKEDEARFLYLRGVNAEENGRLSIATQYYRRAIQMEPNIESKFNDYNADLNSEDSSDMSDDEEADLSDLLTYFARLESPFLICQPDNKQQMAHMSMLPREVALLIVRWIVGEHLDVESLATFAAVCRGFYVCSRDESIWKLICQRIFGDSSSVRFNSYRNMYLEIPHLRYSGCYISRTTYFRAGEKNFEKHSAPFHLVEYFRYVHFFPQGGVLMLTSPDDPASTVSRLKSRNANVAGILSGRYTITNDIVKCVLQRKCVKPIQSRRLRHQINDQEQTFFVNLLIRDIGRRKFSQLNWLSYSIHTLYRKSGEEMIADFELRSSSYPPLHFSLVRSYTTNPQVPL